jgi:hypothetical protein
MLKEMVFPFLLPLTDACTRCFRLSSGFSATVLDFENRYIWRLAKTILTAVLEEYPFSLSESC